MVKSRASQQIKKFVSDSTNTGGRSFLVKHPWERRRWLSGLLLRSVTGASSTWT